LSASYKKGIHTTFAYVVHIFLNKKYSDFERNSIFFRKQGRKNGLKVSLRKRQCVKISPKQAKRYFQEVIQKILRLKFHVLGYSLERKCGQIFITKQRPQTAH
jgi:hypothetical protein